MYCTNSFRSALHSRSLTVYLQYSFSATFFKPIMNPASKILNFFIFLFFGKRKLNLIITDFRRYSIHPIVSLCSNAEGFRRTFIFRIPVREKSSLWSSPKEMVETGAFHQIHQKIAGPNGL